MGSYHVLPSLSGFLRAGFAVTKIATLKTVGTSVIIVYRKIDLVCMVLFSFTGSGEILGFVVSSDSLRSWGGPPPGRVSHRPFRRTPIGSTLSVVRDPGLGQLRSTPPVPLRPPERSLSFARFVNIYFSPL